MSKLLNKKYPVKTQEDKPTFNESLLAKHKVHYEYTKPFSEILKRIKKLIRRK